MLSEVVPAGIKVRELYCVDLHCKEETDTLILLLRCKRDGIILLRNKIKIQGSFSNSLPLKSLRFDWQKMLYVTTS